MRAAISALLCAALPFSSLAQTPGMRGFLSKDIQSEQQLEKQAQAVPDSTRLRRNLELIAGKPHNAGSAGSKAIAEYILGQLKSYGLDAHIEEFEALMPYPTVRRVEVLGPKPYIATLKETALPQDPTSGQTGQLPTFNAYGASGDVTGPVVYANYGIPEDYEWLTKQGIDVKGKIVITRYGKSWRGIKPKVAAEHGAIACLIYSDPHEDGYYEENTFPQGPMRPPQGVQRGSVLDMPLYPGDPLSPGWASEKGSKRLTIAEAKSIMKIPVLPISYQDALPILQQLTGPVVPADWRGNLAMTYHAGPGTAKLHIKTDYDWSTRPLYDVIATIPGSDLPDEWIIAGNHHDAWVNGANDPVSGAVALMETARSLGTLQQTGWKPKRTIKIAFWDGEEFGLLGSTEWAEKHQEELKQKAAVYLNSDSTDKGWLNVEGSHTLEAFVTELATSIEQPGTSMNLADALLKHLNENPREGREKKNSYTIGALGAGSDYVAFLDYLGVASMNEGFSGQTKSGIYHSIYDDPYWYEHFSDSDFVDGRTLAQYTATALLRLGDSTILPFEFGHFSTTVNGYLDDLEKQAEKSGQKLDFNALRAQLKQLTETGSKYDSLLKNIEEKSQLPEDHVRALNEALMRTERVLTRPEGLPNRDWYKHQIYSPGFYTGYGVKTLPGIREAVDSKDWSLAQKETVIVEQCLAEMNQVVSKAYEALSTL